MKNDNEIENFDDFNSIEPGNKVSSDVLVIPDVHGRRFWKHAVTCYPDAHTIFLGDYHDPYPQEDISVDESLENFKEILAYARTHPNVKLLLGNHDLHYFCKFGDYCRFDFWNAVKIRTLLQDNFDLFSLMTWLQFGEKKVLFSHAPILMEWQHAIGCYPNDIFELDCQMQDLLGLVKTDPVKATKTLGFTSKYRSGNDAFGSIVWADLRELFKRHITHLADYSIFGHTQVEKPIVIDSFADLDCRKAFLVSPNLEIDSITY